jgi:ubiquinone/menaquinone biosynthesis C-methylase UbiE
MPTKTKDGSYTFEQFTPTSQNQEINRLKYQASSLLPIEQQIWQTAGLQEGMQVLDIGCGTGSISAEIARKIPQGTVQGIDLSTTLLETATNFQVAQQIPNLSFAAGDVYDLPVEDKTIDFVYGRLLFQHLNEPLRALAEIDRVLKPGGKICLVDVVNSWFVLHPEPVVFSTLRHRLAEIQQTAGGDRQVGGKLGSYLWAAGFTEIETKIEVVTSDRLGGISQFLALLSFGNPYQKIDPELEILATSARKMTDELVNLPHAWAAFGLFVITGTKRS